MRIDSHQHFWHYEPIKHAWIDDEMHRIRRDYTPKDLAPLLAASGMAGCVAVQADQTTAETDFLLTIAAENDFIKGVVGWIDLRAEDLEEQLDHYAGQPKLKGWRHVVQGEPDPFFLLRDDFLRGIETIGKHGYTYDILIFP
ncbi:MAG: amidohydrolase family protein, partial [Bacteroidota bacterium]